ncbi:hypothetical protein PTSG_02944 [Salpingoeca rosetta]|uniref:Pre-rRNA-processing protein TSR2 homolog n=1 Tax=Salpingoeca rosetta (strain ATCC 50818 / BSB-021) TaxID=946362 RepID=F2U3T0_SALR5|nr:uncharacterized protein PTSG_02944 [Salpingoeca rosetta]EGD82274.1 hypothetical protein PTSG_02944 [Salpingoeca rosetta]|eukprot:XP_004996457.1 hypothetical protein PTSG_02944 [Salpingoeca rosetta]
MAAKMEGVGESKALFQAGVGHAFDDWDVVGKAIDNQWGGEHTDEKVEWMKEVVAEWFFEIPGEPPTAQEVAWYIGEIFTNEFNVMNDGSMASDIAAVLVDLFRLQANNNTAELQKFCEEAEARHAKSSRARGRRPRRAEPDAMAESDDASGDDDSDDDDDDDDEEEGDGQDGNANEEQEEDDGWTTVGPKSGKQKGKKQKGGKGSKKKHQQQQQQQQAVPQLESGMDSVQLNE